MNFAGGTSEGVAPPILILVCPSYRHVFHQVGVRLRARDSPRHVWRSRTVPMSSSEIRRCVPVFASCSGPYRSSASALASWGVCPVFGRRRQRRPKLGVEVSPLVATGFRRVRFFRLHPLYEEPKRRNDKISSYAFELDR